MDGGGVDLLQYYHGVPDMPMQKVHPYRRLCPRPPPTPLDWDAVGKAILYVCGSPSGGGVLHFLLPPASPPCCLKRVKVRNKVLTKIALFHSDCGYPRSVDIIPIS